MNRPALILSALLLSASLAMPPDARAAEAAESIAAAGWEDARYHVAQVVENKSVSTLAATAQLTTVYRGGIAAPFGTLLTVWDPTPQDGGDFGTFRTFDLGNFASVPQLKSKRVRKIAAGETLIEFTLAGLVPNAELTGTESFKWIASVTIRDGEVQGTLNLKRVK